MHIDVPCDLCAVLEHRDPGNSGLHSGKGRGPGRGVPGKEAGRLPTPEYRQGNQRGWDMLKDPQGTVAEQD